MTALRGGEEEKRYGYKEGEESGGGRFSLSPSAPYSNVDSTREEGPWKSNFDASKKPLTGKQYKRKQPGGWRRPAGLGGWFFWGVGFFLWGGGLVLWFVVWGWGGGFGGLGGVVFLGLWGGEGLGGGCEGGWDCLGGGCFGWLCGLGFGGGGGGMWGYLEGVVGVWVSGVWVWCFFCWGGVFFGGLLGVFVGVDCLWGRWWAWWVLELFWLFGVFFFISGAV